MEAFIVDGYRSPIGKADKGSFRNTRPDDIAVTVIKHLLAKVPALDPARVDDVIVGNAVPEAEQGLQMARWIALMAISKDIPGVTINRYCASGLEAIAMAHAKIVSGMADCIIAGGTESMSMVPVRGWKTSPNYNLAHDFSDYFIGMGLTGEEVAEKYRISRDDQDRFSLRSHQNAVNAIKKGIFTDEIAPVKTVEVYVENNERKVREYTVSADEGPREDTNLETLSELKPVFRLNGSITAGNSSQRSDGSSFVLVMSEKMVRELNLEPAGKLRGVAVAGVDPRIMGIGPAEAIPKVLKQTGLSLNNLDLIEINEAFASQTLAVIRELDLNPEIINVNGGAIATGHPLGCTGCKLTVQVLHQLKRQKKKHGLITACVGGGQGIAGIVERF